MMNRRHFLKLALALPFLRVAKRLPALPAAQTASPNAPNILLLLFDTFSAQHISMQGYGRATTPNLARLVEQATVFHAHYSTANFTTPATSSLLTGTYPWTHRAFHINGLVNDEFVSQNVFTEMGQAGYERITYTHSSLVALLLEQFYQDLDTYLPPRELCLFDETLADRLFPNDFVKAFLGEKSILPRDRDVLSTSLFFSLLDGRRREALIEETRQRYRDLFPRGTPRVDYIRYFLLEDAINWVWGEVNKPHERPFFLYAHLYPPHGPYNTRTEFINWFESDSLQPVEKPLHPFSEGVSQQLLNQNRRQYDEFIPYVDAEFGRLYDLMEKNGILDNTYVVITSDHGQLFERGIHGHITPTLFEPLIHIPLIIFKPGQQTRQDVYTRTSSVDLLPTLLHLAEQPIPPWCEGQILPTFRQQQTDNGRSIFALEAKENGKNAPLTRATASLLKDNYKLTRYWGYEQAADRYELYDLSNDPQELNDLYVTNSVVGRELAAELLTKLESMDSHQQ